MDRKETLYSNAERFAKYYYDQAKDGKVTPLLPFERELLQQGEGAFMDYFTNAFKLNLEKDYGEDDWDDAKAERLNKTDPYEGVGYVLYGGTSPEQKDYQAKFSKFKEIIEDGKWYNMSPKELSTWASDPKHGGYDMSSDKERKRFWDDLQKFDIDYNRAKNVYDDTHSFRGITGMFAMPTLYNEAVRQSLTGDFDDSRANAAAGTDLVAGTLLGASTLAKTPWIAAGLAGGTETGRQFANLGFGNETNWGAPAGASLSAMAVPAGARYLGTKLISKGRDVGSRPMSRGFLRGLRGADDPVVAERNALKESLINARNQSMNAQKNVSSEPVGNIAGVAELENAATWENAAKQLEALGYTRRYVQNQLEGNVEKASAKLQNAEQSIDQVIDSKLPGKTKDAMIEFHGANADAAQKELGSAVKALDDFEMGKSTIEVSADNPGPMYVEDVIGVNPDQVQPGSAFSITQPEYSVEYVLKNSYDKNSAFPTMSASEVPGYSAYKDNELGLNLLKDTFPEKYSMERGLGASAKKYNTGLLLGHLGKDLFAPFETITRMTPAEYGLIPKGVKGFDQKVQEFKQNEWFQNLPEEKKNIIEEAFKKAAKKKGVK